VSRWLTADGEASVPQPTADADTRSDAGLLPLLDRSLIASLFETLPAAVLQGMYFSFLSYFLLKSTKYKLN
jgi:hypothetical protein